MPNYRHKYFPGILIKYELRLELKTQLTKVSSLKWRSLSKTEVVKEAV